MCHFDNTLHENAKWCMVFISSTLGMEKNMKICKKCGKEKPLDKFQLRKNKKGEMNPVATCKQCAVDYNTAYRKTPNGYKKLREYRTSQKSKDLTALANKKFRESDKWKEWWEKNKHRYSCQIFARNSSRETIKSNNITRDRCVICGSTEELEGHHDDYSKPLDVVILCRTHHSAIHTYLNRGKTHV